MIASKLRGMWSWLRERVVSRALLVSLALLVAYILAYLVLTPLLGRGATSLSFLPVALIGWLYGLHAGCLAAAVIVPLNLLLLMWTGESDWGAMLRSGGAMGIVALVVIAVVSGRMSDLSRRVRQELEARRAAEEANEALIADLRRALSEVRTLKGLLPICANCKKVRDDSGYWSSVEQFIRQHVDVQFTHSLCPECLRTLYPDVYEEMMIDGALTDQAPQAGQRDS